MSEITDRPLTIGDWLVDPTEDTISSNDKRCKLEPRAMKLLLLLTSSAGTVISREHLLETIWANVEVTDNSLNQAIRHLRKVLGDDLSKPKYIQTIPKRGYKLVAQVSAPELQTSSAIKKGKSGWITLTIVVLVLLVVIISVTALLYEVADNPSSQGTIRPVTTLKGNSLAPDFSPDEQHLSFAHNPDAGSPWKIFISDLRQNIIRQISNGNDQDLPQLWHSDENGKVQQLTQFDVQYDMKRLQWSPNDQFLLCHGQGRLFKMDITNRDIQWLTEQTSLALHGMWSRDDQSIYFSSDRSGDWQIWKLNLVDLNIVALYVRSWIKADGPPHQVTNRQVQTVTRQSALESI